MSEVNPIPEGFHTLTPHITVKNTKAALEFYKKAFGGETLFTMPGPDGESIMHAEVQIGDSRLMVCDEFPGGCKAPPSLNGTTVALTLYVKDADAAFKQAVDAGAKAEMPPMDMFWGDRYGKVSDPFGHCWAIATHMKDLSPEELEKAAAAAMSEMCKPQ